MAQQEPCLADRRVAPVALSKRAEGIARAIERRGISFKGELGDGGIGPKQTNFHRVENDPHPIRVDFRFARFADVTKDTYASDHCPLFLTIP